MSGASTRLGIARRILCINCNICVNTCNAVRHHLVVQLDQRVISLICNWISPVIVTEDDYICEPCYHLALQNVNVQLHEAGQHVESAQQQGSSCRGHSQVCLVCGRSLANKQRHLLLSSNLSEHHRRVIEIIENQTNRQIARTDHACHACWMRASRSSLRVYEMDRRRLMDNDGASGNLDGDLIIPETISNVSRSPEPSISGYSEPSIAMVQETSISGSSGPSASVRPEPSASQILRETNSDELILPNYRRSPNTASHCIFTECNRVTDLHVISDPLRVTILKSYQFYIPIFARVCTEHLEQNCWNLLYNAESSTSSFTAQQVEHIFSFVQPVRNYLDFTSIETVQQMDEHLYKYWMGLTRDNFMRMLDDLPRILELKRGLLGFGTLLIKMRTGESNVRLSTLLGVPRSTLERLLAQAREITQQDFVPNNLGLTHLRREEIYEHNLTIPNGLYNENNNQAIVICDGTYVYSNKSSNYRFQKDSYSLHKYRNLLKPFLIVLTDGYILDCFGPYKATTSDAEIMKSLFHDENAPIRTYFQENDIFILDRGFRDSISLLERCNYKTCMPESLLEGEHQLTCAQANRSRCVTACRWVVEVVNGYFKRDFRLLRFNQSNKSIPNMMVYFQIAAALINKFGVRLRDRREATQIVNIMRERMALENNLSVMVTQLNLNRRTSSFRSITANNNNILFPRLEYNDLLLFAVETYQIRQARSYYGEHVRFHGGYRIEVSIENNPNQLHLMGRGDLLIRGKIKSRHVSRRQYYVYIVVNNNLNGREAIVEYCCSCLVGRRTVGCCAHTMTLVWFLGWARHQPNISAPAAFLDEVVIREGE